jgi:hypothetical protein
VANLKFRRSPIGTVAAYHLPRLSKLLAIFVTALFITGRNGAAQTSTAPVPTLVIPGILSSKLCEGQTDVRDFFATRLNNPHLKSGTRPRAGLPPVSGAIHQPSRQNLQRPSHNHLSVPRGVRGFVKCEVLMSVFRPPQPHGPLASQVGGVDRRSIRAHPANARPLSGVTAGRSTRKPLFGRQDRSARRIFFWRACWETGLLHALLHERKFVRSPIASIYLRFDI